MAKDVSTILSSDVIDRQKINVLEISKSLILRDLNAIRSNLQFTDNSVTNSNMPPIKESFCHAFFRSLGLPVISADRTRYYNPGFFGADISSIELERRNAIDQAQDANLLTIESKREFACYFAGLSFESDATKYQYRFDMMKQPMSVYVMDDNLGAFDLDLQQDQVDNRAKFKPAQKILRPFKCVPAITNNIVPSTNMILAPFINDANSAVRDTTLSKPYLEFVARIRLSKDITSNTESLELSEALLQRVEVLGVDSLSELLTSIKELSAVELYIIEQLIISLIDVCNKVNKEKQKAQNIISKLEARIDNEKISFTTEGITFDTLEKWIQQKKEKIAAKEIILSQIPNFDISGIGISNNKIKCITSNAFISLIQPDIMTLRKELDELNNEKTRRMNLFNASNAELFYSIGEVNGFGLIDAIAMMLSFWLLSTEELVSMLDDESFNRLLREPSLYSDAVEERKDNGSAIAPIAGVIESFDKNVSDILKLANEIVESGKI